MILPALLMALTLAGQADTPPPAAPPTDATEVSEVVVTARRIGVPVWRVGDGRSSVIFVGSIGAVPESVTWNSAELERAVAGSRRVLFGANVSFTVGDLYRMLFHRDRYVALPEGQSLETVTGPDLARRLDALAAADRLPRDWRTQRTWWVALQLRMNLTRRPEVERGTTAQEAADRAGDRARVHHESVLRARFNDIVENASRERPTDLACLQSMADVAEAGLPAFVARAEAWRHSRIAETVAAPLSRAEAACWPDSDPTLAPQLRASWREAVRRELAQAGAVVAVAPLTYLVERGGLLDDLQSQGYAIEGPAWR